MTKEQAIKEWKYGTQRSFIPIHPDILRDEIKKLEKTNRSLLWMLQRMVDETYDGQSPCLLTHEQARQAIENAEK